MLPQNKHLTWMSHPTALNIIPYGYLNYGLHWLKQFFLHIPIRIKNASFSRVESFEKANFGKRYRCRQWKRQLLKIVVVFDADLQTRGLVVLRVRIVFVWTGKAISVKKGRVEAGHLFRSRSDHKLSKT